MSLKRNVLKMSFCISVLAIALLAMMGCTKGKTTYEKDVEVLNDNFDVDIFVYGKNLDFRYGLEYSQIDTMSEAESDADYTFLILNLDENSTPLSENDLTQLLNYMNEGNYKVIYLNPSIYAENLYSFNEELLGSLSPQEINVLLLVDGEIETNLNSDNCDNSTIVHLMIRDIKIHVENQN